MNSFYCSRPVKSSGELKSRGVKLLPGKDNTNKLSLSKSFMFFLCNCLCMFFFNYIIYFFNFHFNYFLFNATRVSVISMSLLVHYLDSSYSTRFCRSAVTLSFWWALIHCNPRRNHLFSFSFYLNNSVRS